MPLGFQQLSRTAVSFVRRSATPRPKRPPSEVPEKNGQPAIQITEVVSLSDELSSLELSPEFNRPFAALSDASSSSLSTSPLSVYTAYTYASTLSDRCSVCKHTELKFLAVHWPEPYVGLDSTTHSLRNVDNMDVRFRGPVPAVVLLHLDDTTGTRGLLSECDYLIPDEPLVGGPLKIAVFTMEGRIWSAFTAFSTSHPESTDGKPVTLIAKFTTPKEHDADTDCVMGEVGREAWLYDNNLCMLQGSVVPTWYGIYFAWQSSYGGTSTSEVLCAVMDYAGTSVTDELVASLSPEDKHVIADKYQALHDAGIVHVSCTPKHWLLEPGAPVDTLKIIDFGNSLIRPTHAAEQVGLDTWLDTEYTDMDWLEAANAEMMEVRAVLRMEDS